MWPWMIVVDVNHGISALLLVPSVYGLTNKRLANALALLGTAYEMSYEIQDLCVNFYIRYTCGKKAKPNVFLASLLLHHSVSFMTVLPMNLYYGEEYNYHRIVHSMLLGSVILGFVNEFQKTLNVKKKNHLILM